MGDINMREFRLTSYKNKKLCIISEKLIYFYNSIMVASPQEIVSLNTTGNQDVFINDRFNTRVS